MTELLRRSRRLALGAALLGLAGLAVLAFACGDDDDGDGGDANTEAAEAAVRAAIDAWNAGDLEGFLNLFTDEGLDAAYGGFTRDELLGGIGDAGDPQITIDSLSAEPDGEQVAVDVVTTEGAFQVRQRVTLIEQDGAWLANDFAYQTQDVPDDRTAVDVSVLEFSFEFDESQITGGNLAFNVRNAGAEPHEMLLVSVPEDLDVEEALQSDEEPEGVEDVGFIGPWSPGAEVTAILVEDLDPGRYVMLCFIPDAEGTPHAVRGMWDEFTIE